MNKVMIKEENKEPPSSRSYELPANDTSHANSSGSHGISGWLKSFLKNKNNTSLRDAIEEYIDDTSSAEQNGEITIGDHERSLLTNILKLRDMTVVDVMIPRADIAAISKEISQSDLLMMLAERQFSRIPVYGESLDDILGTIHIKDILQTMAQGKPIVIEDLLREVPIVSPAMHVLDLLLMMKQMRKHLVLVVDEYGGIDGLATVGDIIEAIVGDIEDEYNDDDSDPRMQEMNDFSVMADARIDLDTFQERFGKILTEDELEENDTIGGLIFSLAGRVPVRGEILNHPSGMIFEVLDADTRRLNRVRIRNIPNHGPAAE
jgi:magnesium and cobalt transporter